MLMRRSAALYSGMLLFLFIVICRLNYIAHNKYYAKNAAEQIVTTLPIQSDRGDFYDCTGQKLTGRETEYYALCVPGDANYAKLFQYADDAEQARLYKMRNSATPFLIKVNRDLTIEGVYTVSRENRYAELGICTHLVGYLNGEQTGVSGLESAFDEELKGSGKSGYVQCVTNAKGALLEKTQPEYVAPSDDSLDVQLTIDSEIQRAAEGIGAEMMTTGCIVIMDVSTGRVRACVSVPDYCPNNIASSMEAEGAPLLNRAFSAYAVGSVFKPVLAAAALQENKSALSIECTGGIQVSDHIYRCAGGVPHGQTDLSDALAKSCNCYFITLGQKLGTDTLTRYSAAFGFGEPIYLVGGLKASAGNVPSAERLSDLGQLSNFSFGQGELLATPIQVAAMMNTIAAGGIYRTPSFLERTFDADSGETVQELYNPQERTVMSEKNAAALREMLAGVVSDGLGKEAQPTFGTAAGKTGTAQTGRFDDKNQEYKNLWFAGYYPAENPQYTIAVMQDDQTNAAHSSAAVFSRVCDALALLRYVQIPENAPLKNS